MPPNSPAPPDDGDTLSTLATFLCQRSEQITSRWMAAVRANPVISSADHLDYHALADHLPKLFDDLADVLRGEGVASQTRQDAESHGAHRWQQSYSLEEVVHELGIVHDIVVEQGLEAFEDAHPDVPRSELRRARKLIMHFFGSAAAGSIRQYAQKQAEESNRLHEQLGEADRALTSAVRTEHDRLAKTAEQRRLALDSAQMGWWHFDVPADQIHWDERLQNIFGLGKELVSYEEVMARVHPEDRQRLSDLVQASIRPHDPTPCVIEYRVVHDDGTVRWVAARGQAAFVGEGDGRRCTSLVGTLLDITESKAVQDSLRLNEERHRLAIDGGQLGTFTWDIVSRRVHWNRRMKEFFFLPPEAEMSFELGMSRLHPDDREPTRRAVAEAMDGRTSYAIDYRAVSPETGQVRWLHATGRAFADAITGELTRVHGVTVDITAQKLAQEEIASAAQRERTVLESITDRFFAFDANWRFTYLNESAKLGMAPHVTDPASLIGRNFFEVFPANRGTPIEQAGLRTMAEGILTEFETFYEPWDRWYTGRCFPVQGGGLSVYFRDVTTEKRAIEALRASETKYRALFNSVDSAFCVLEMIWDEVGKPVDYRFIEVNPNFERHNGLYDAAGKTALELIPNLEARWFEVFGQVARTGKPLRFVESSEAMGRWFELYAFPLGEEADRRVAVLFSDITERRRTEVALQLAKTEAEAASRAKDDFLAALSHELRTPLTPVLMAASDLCDDPALPANMRDTLRMMQRNIGLEARLIDDLLDLTRIAKGKLELRAQDCEAHSLVGLAVEIVRDDAQAKGITLGVELGAKQTHFVGDPARVQQVFWNLLKNAVKFTPAGGLVTIRSHDVGDLLVIEVNDTGLGLAPESLESIFQPFEQAGFVNNARFGGLGLGLAIAKAIVELHGGTIRAESAGLGQGATFRIELTGNERLLGITEAGGQPSAVPAVPEPSAPTLVTNPQRLLLVEDHEATLQVLTRLLVRAGYTVTTATSVAEAKAAAALVPFDVVISDVGLPDGTGIELMDALHTAYGLRGIALTGYGMEDDLRRTREVGFVEHLVKPVDFAQLRRAIERVAIASP